MLILCLSDGEGKTSMMLDKAVEDMAKSLDLDYYLFPESGIHPSGHADITESLVKIKDTIMVATHSEVIVLRAMRMIREGRISKDKVAIRQYLNNANNDGYYWHKIELSDEGDMLDHFSGGFFETGFKERFA